VRPNFFVRWSVSPCNFRRAVPIGISDTGFNGNRFLDREPELGTFLNQIHFADAAGVEHNIMSTLLDVTTVPAIVETRARPDQEIFFAVRCLLGTQHGHAGLERRREQRFPYPYPIRLTPVTTDGTVPPAESIVVLGKHLNDHGLDFYFKEPLAYRRVIASFEQNGREVMHILMELTWCRFGRHGWYENGGRFLQVLPSAAPLPDRS
jgi:hypothetical protein